MLESARTLKADGHILIVDFAPHELEFLREEQQHRYLGIKEDQITHGLVFDLDNGSGDTFPGNLTVLNTSNGVVTEGVYDLSLKWTNPP